MHPDEYELEMALGRLCGALRRPEELGARESVQRPAVLRLRWSSGRDSKSFRWAVLRSHISDRFILREITLAPACLGALRGDPTMTMDELCRKELLVVRDTVLPAEPFSHWLDVARKRAVPLVGIQVPDGSDGGVRELVIQDGWPQIDVSWHSGALDEWRGLDRWIDELHGFFYRHSRGLQPRRWQDRWIDDIRGVFHRHPKECQPTGEEEPVSPDERDLELALTRLSSSSSRLRQDLDVPEGAVESPPRLQISRTFSRKPTSPAWAVFRARAPDSLILRKVTSDPESITALRARPTMTMRELAAQRLVHVRDVALDPSALEPWINAARSIAVPLAGIQGPVVCDPTWRYLITDDGVPRVALSWASTPPGKFATLERWHDDLYAFFEDWSKGHDAYPSAAQRARSAAKARLAARRRDAS